MGLLKPQGLVRRRQGGRNVLLLSFLRLRCKNERATPYHLRSFARLRRANERKKWQLPPCRRREKVFAGTAASFGYGGIFAAGAQKYRNEIGNALWYHETRETGWLEGVGCESFVFDPPWHE
jgi:hypothetical protein